MPVPALVLRIPKGSPVTPGEMDNNFTILCTFANGLETRINVSVAPDGTLNANVVDTLQIKDQAVTAQKIADAVMGDGLKRAIPGDHTTPLTVNVDGTTIVIDGTTKALKLAPNSPGMQGLMLILADDKATGTNGGTFTTGLEITRQLNPVPVVNQIVTGVAVTGSGNSNAPVGQKITLPAGTYNCYISVPGYACQAHKAVLYNVTAGALLVNGTSESAPVGSGTAATMVQSRSIVAGQFTLLVSSDVEIRHRCSNTQAANGLGALNNFSFGGTPAREIYTVAQFWKIA